MDMDVASQPRAPQRAQCTLQEAVCLLANEPITEPSDPCTGEAALKDFSQDHTSRWLLVFLVVMRALAASHGEGDPPAPASILDPRLRFRADAHALCSDEIIWAKSVAAMREHCAVTVKTAAYWVAAWAPFEPRALAYFQALEQRNQNLTAAREALRAAVISANGPLMYGRNRATGAFGEIARGALADPRACWEIDKAAKRDHHAIRFTGGLDTPMGRFDEVCFSRSEIMALAQRSPSRAAPRTKPPAKPTKLSAAKDAAEHVFPKGPPAGMPAKVRDDKINEELVRRCGNSANPRMMRTVAADLVAEGKWPHGPCQA